MYRRWGKRLLDVFIAVPALAAAMPFMAVTSLLLWVKLGESPLFVQRRTGLRGRIFRLIKLKTMRTGFDDEGNLLPDHLRTTRLGAILRRTSLDELPQLWNIIKGDMSIAGPRPLLPEYLPYYSAQQDRRHEVKPGLTGWAQVNGRYSVSWEQRFDYDVWYVDHVSLETDLKIICMTIRQLAGFRGSP